MTKAKSDALSRRQFVEAGGIASLGLLVAPESEAKPQLMDQSHIRPPYQTKMKLSPEEQAILNGEKGATLQKVMETLTRYGDIFGAVDFVPLDGPIHSVSSFALVYLEDMYGIVEELSLAGLKTQLPFTANPKPTDYDNVQMNFLEKVVFKRMFPRQKPYEFHLQKIGIRDAESYSCACYQDEVGNIPTRGDIICWSESSAVSYANSVLGARSNRNSGLIDFFCGILGKSPRFGFLTHEGRMANVIVEINTKEKPDPWILGVALGNKVLDGTPYIKGLEHHLGTEITPEVKDYCKDMGAAAASSGAIGLYHLNKLTPEALDHGESLIQKNANTIIIDDAVLAETTASFVTQWRQKESPPDICILGCPHNSFTQLNSWANKILKSLEQEGVETASLRCFLTAPDPTHERFRTTYPEKYAELMASGVEIGSPCALMTAKNPLISRKRIITNSSKLQHYSNASFAPESVILQALSKGVLS